MIRYSATIEGEAWKINVKYYQPPIPIRCMDWFAGFDNHEGKGVHSPTLADALEDLVLDVLDTNDYCSLTYDKPNEANK